MAETLTVQMERLLDEYSERVQNVTNVAIQRVGRESVKMLRNSSPHKTGDYSRGWRLKTLRSRGPVVDVVVHNATDYQLTHLLENGHIVRNAKGVFGRAPAHPHIKPVETWANSELPEEIERELR
ncbi:MAG: HK97 gp10 family phage protein [Clostridia bacterium]|nr:HK97 gp10 family phage protein [Clostridia bacterium]